MVKFTGDDLMIQHTTNPITLEAVVEYYLPTDPRGWIPNGSSVVEFIVDSDDYSEMGDSCMDDLATEWLRINHPNCSFTRVFTSNLW